MKGNRTKSTTDKTISTSKCESCVNGELIDDKMAKVMVRCKARQKNYVYGQKIVCNERKER